MKINLGCGNIKKDGYVNCDIREHVNPDQIVDVREPLPWSDESVDVVACENLFDSLTRVEFNNLIREIHRILKPNGLLTFIQMDISKNLDSGVGWPHFVCGVTRNLFNYYEAGNSAHENWKEVYNLPTFSNLIIHHNDNAVMIGSMRKELT